MTAFADVWEELKDKPATAALLRELAEKVDIITLINQRFDAIEKRLETLDTKLDATITKNDFARMDAKLDGKFDWLAGLIKPPIS